MENTIVVALGYSKSGKDTAIKTLLEKRYLPTIHPINDLKEFLKNHYNQPNLDLNLTEDKNKRIHEYIEDSLTFSQLLVNLHKFFIVERNDPYFSLPYIYKQAYDLLSYYDGFSIQGIRNIKEAECLFNIAKKYDSKILTLYITRNNAQPETSDLYLDTLLTLFQEQSTNFYTVYNNNTIESFQSKILLIYDEFINTYTKESWEETGDECIEVGSSRSFMSHEERYKFVKEREYKSEK